MPAIINDDGSSCSIDTTPVLVEQPDHAYKANNPLTVGKLVESAEASICITSDTKCHSQLNPRAACQDESETSQRDDPRAETQTVENVVPVMPASAPVAPCLCDCLSCRQSDSTNDNFVSCEEGTQSLLALVRKYPFSNRPPNMYIA